MAELDPSEWEIVGAAPAASIPTAASEQLNPDEWEIAPINGPSAPAPLPQSVPAAYAQGLWTGTKNLPSAIYHLPGDTLGLAKDTAVGLYNLPASLFDPSQERGAQLEATGRTLGKVSTGTAGALAGGSLGLGTGPFAPLAVPVFAGLGYATGSGLYDYLADEVRSLFDPGFVPKTAIERANEFGQAQAQATEIGAGARAVNAAGARVLGPSTPEAIAAQAGGDLATITGNENLAIPRPVKALSAATTAELTREPSLAAAEATLARRGPADIQKAAADAIAKRADARAKVISAVSPDEGIPPDVLGEDIRTTLSEQYGKTKAATGEEYAATDMEGWVPTHNAIKAVMDDLGKFRKPERFVDSELQGLLDDLKTTPQDPRLGNIQELRSKALEIADSAGRAGLRKKASIANSVADNLRAAVQKAADNGALPPEIAEQWLKANKARAAQGKTYEQGVVRDILRERGYGEFSVPDSVIADKVLSKPENVRQIIEAAGTDATPVLRLRALARAKMESLQGKNLLKWLDSHDSQLKQILSRDQYRALKGAKLDLESEMEKTANATAASKSVSPTAQILKQDANLAKILGEDVEPGMVGRIGRKTGLATGAAIGTGIGALFGQPYVGTVFGAAIPEIISAVKERPINIRRAALFKALQNPEYARKSVKAYNAPALDQALTKLDRSVAIGALDSARRDALTERERRKTIELLPQSYDITEESPVGPQTMNREIMLDAIRQVESHGDVNAVSNKGARGPYQLMPAIAKHYGVDPHNEQQARGAASAYIDDELEALHDPLLAIAAYNAGRPAVLRAIDKAGGSTEYWDIAPYLPHETQDYVSKVVNAMERLQSTMV